MGIKSVKEFDLLYKSYYSALCYFAIKIVADRDSAEDIVDEVFAGLLTSKREFSESDNLKAWLYTATRNASLNHLKREQHIKEHQLQFSLKHEREESPYLFEMIRTEVFRNILLEIKKLPGHSGKIIEMSYFEGMKNDQIAELLGLSIKTVKNLKSLGLAELKTRLTPEVFLYFMILASTLNTPLFYN